MMRILSFFSATISLAVSFSMHPLHTRSRPSITPLQAEDPTLRDFNPFASNPTTQISLRQEQMKGIMGDLLANAMDEEKCRRILQENQDFLLLPIEHGVAEADSIYKPEMTREQRFATYANVMDERIQNARHPATRNILTRMKEFVQSFL